MHFFTQSVLFEYLFGVGEKLGIVRLPFQFLYNNALSISRTIQRIKTLTRYKSLLISLYAVFIDNLHNGFPFLLMQQRHEQRCFYFHVARHQIAQHHLLLYRLNITYHARGQHI